MARIEHIEARLQRWAEWRKAGDGSGYPVTSVLHESWSPPTSASASSWRPAGCTDARQTHRMLQAMQLSQAKQATLAAIYLQRMTPAEAACLLECQVDTVHDRIERVHAEMARVIDGFCNIQQPV